MDDFKSIQGKCLFNETSHLKLVVWSSRYKSKISMNIPQVFESDLVWKHLSDLLKGGFWATFYVGNQKR